MYVLQVERLERQVLADRQVIAVYRAANITESELPSVTDVRAEFDTALQADPGQLSPTEQRLRELGVS